MKIRSFENAGALVDLTPSINSIENKWGLVSNMGLFEDRGVTQRSIIVESRGETIGLVESTPWGQRSQMVGKDDQFQTRSFAIPHMALADAIEPADVQGRRMYGTESEAETVANVRLRKLSQFRNSFDITKEFLRVQAIKGTVVTPNGVILSDLYSDFGVTQEVVDFELATSTTNVESKIESVIAHIQDNINTGAVVDDIVVLCSPSFFSALIAHDTIEKAYMYYNNQNQEASRQVLRDRLGSGLYRTFLHKGLTFVEYRGSYNYQGTTVTLLDAEEAYAFPTGTSGIFEGYFAPMDHMDYVNTIGESYYALSYVDPKGFGEELFAESNYLPIVRRPQAVVKCVTGS